MIDYWSFACYHPVLGAWVLPAALAVASLVGGWISQSRQKRHNRELAEYQADANERYLNQQLQYNDPASQMNRFREAGLNPNLVYGQGTPGNQSAPLTYPDVQPANMDIGFGQAVQAYNQSAMTQSQTSAIDAKTRQTYVMTAINKLQQRVLERNPLLDAGAYNAIIDSLKSSAEIKAADAAVKGETAQWFTGEKRMEIGGQAMHGPAGVLKMETELKLLEQRFQLGGMDQKIKSEVLQSKEFQNALLEIQTKWMKDAEITPQHILQFIQLLLLKLL